ncbi:hypothetical protein ACGFR6_04365 [Streptomyces sp. NPDC048567]|uniref:hypothetical protein n=1 Tax=Streptomyces sp. NPDC048567 TaxID=3365570 RepID=UPI003710249F
MEQVADREAQMEHGLIAAYDEYELDFAPAPEPNCAPCTPPPHHTAAPRRRSLGR